MSAKKVYFDTLRSLAFGGISADYAAVGAILAVNPRIITIVNDTNAGMIFSFDSTIAAGQFYLPATTNRQFNFTSNLVPGKDDNFVLAKGIILYVKQASAPASGAVYFECAYASP